MTLDELCDRCREHVISNPFRVTRPNLIEVKHGLCDECRKRMEADGPEGKP